MLRSRTLTMAVARQQQGSRQTTAPTLRPRLARLEARTFRSSALAAYAKDVIKGGPRSPPPDASQRKGKNPGRGVEGKYVYQMQKVSKYIEGDKPLFEDVSFQIFQGAKIGILGSNGAGKSSLIKIMAGIDSDYDGTARALAGVKVGYLPQEPELDETKTVKENVFDGVQDKKNALERYKELSGKQNSGKPLTQQETVELQKLKTRVDSENLLDLDRKIEVAMIALRCPPGDYSVENLSGGEKRRIALCRLLVSQPDMLLLDEPTNHLDAESVAWLERFLKDYRGAVLAVTHDRYFLDNVAGWIVEVDRGHVYPFEGNYTEWLEAKQKRLEVERKKEVMRAKQIKTELEWINTSPKGRQAKGKARISRYEELLKEAKTRPLEAGQVFIPPGPRLAQLVIKARNITKSFDDRVLFENLSFDIPAAAIVGIIGPNGAGKSTLFNIMAGREQPDSGTIEIGETVKLGFVAQMRDLDPESTIYEEVAEGHDYLEVGQAQPIHVRSYLASFNFKGDVQDRQLGHCSGGERNRVFLAKMLKSCCNVLMLDEPSNDLDVDTLRSLELALVDFPGCALVISHDRWFLDRICTHIMAFEGDSQVYFFEGNYSAYEQDRKERLGNKLEPSRVKYRKLEKI